MCTYAKNKKYCIEEKAKRRYGLTKIFENAGYILEDGSLLDFSRENKMHQASSHGDIKELFKNLNAYDAINKFISRGNIRIKMFCQFEFVKDLTPEQLDILREIEKSPKPKYANHLPFVLERVRFIEDYAGRTQYYSVREYIQSMRTERIDAMEEFIKNKQFCIEERAKKHYGLTRIFEHAGYMLEDGTMLNFCESGYHRDLDHINIGFFYEKAQGYQAMIKFMRRGNVRVCCNSDFCFEFTKPLTKAQIAELREAQKLARKSDKNFYIEQIKITKNGTNRKIYYNLSDYVNGYAVDNT